jgi:hypothetical protein
MIDQTHGRPRCQSCGSWRWWLTLALVFGLLTAVVPIGMAAPLNQDGDDPDGLLAAEISEQERLKGIVVSDDPEAAYTPDYLKLATGGMNRAAEATRYAWPFTLNAMGHTIASYQNYGSSPYFHHGLDILANSGTAVYNRSGGQVVNIENYTPGNDLYWEVAVLDPEGYLWQYHHIEVSSIPQAIYNKFAEYRANPTTGGFIPANTYIGNIVYWPVVTFNERFNHIHLNILGAGGYVNGFAFHTLLNDTSGPQIQAIGLLQNNTIVSGSTVTGAYSMYVRARDLILHTAYYVPPYEIKYSVDGGPEIVTWRFDNLPGGADRYAYVSQFFVSPTCGNYTCRDFYINLGFTTAGNRSFPSTGGQHTILVTVTDDFGNQASQSYTWTVNGPPGGTVIWSDDFETNKGWATNPSGTDTATLGQWERGNPEDTNSSGPKQLGTTVSGSNDLVTGRLAGSSAGAYDIDGGVTSVRSPAITLPGNGDLTLSFSYYLAHATNASSADYLRVKVVGNTTTTVFEELGAADNDDAAWAMWNTSLNAFAGQTVRILVEAADASGASLVEAAIDDVFITSSEPPIPNEPPVAAGQSVATDEDMPLAITLTATDEDGDPLTFSVTGGPAHGSLSGTAPHLTYTPAANYHGADSFTFVANDGEANSNAATVAITVNPVNDAPVANSQAVVTVQDAAVAVTLAASDVDGDGLGYSVVTGPTNGSLSGSVPNLTYAPNAGFTGSDSFTFTASDGQASSNLATVSITVEEINYPPTADSQSVATDEDTPLGITLTAADPNGDPLTYTVTGGPAHGSLSGTAPNLTYTPAANYNGADSFTFVASDGEASSNAATVAIAVNGVNDAPAANSQSVSTVAGAAVAVTLTASDVEGDSLTYSVVGLPANGVLSGAAPALTYTPNAGFTGSDTFTFVANDGQVNSNVATISITVNPAGPTTVFYDDFETNKGWTVNPSGTDTATIGRWERANPQGTTYNGMIMQRDDTVSGSYALVTGPLAGSSAGSYDVDGGVTSVRSPAIVLPANRTLTLAFSYYLAHLNNSSSADYLRVRVVGSSTVTLFQEVGAANNDSAAWASFTADVSQFAGQTVYISIDAADASGASLVEAAVDNVSIVANP